MQMPGRCYSAEDYRYGFQGQETDDEWLGGAISYKYRVHDPRIGRFLSIDPLAPDYPHNSPYAFSENRVIDGIELEGLEVVTVHSFSFAPFDTFAIAYGGDKDNRCYGDRICKDKDKWETNYRIGGSVILDLETDKIIERKLHHSYTNFLKTEDGYILQTESEAEWQEDVVFDNGAFFMQVQGNNDGMTWGWNPGYIDVKIDMQIKFDGYSSDGLRVFNIQGEVYGDRYPSNETYISDISGNKLFLGVSGPDALHPFAPGTELLITAFEDMSRFNFNVVFNEDDTFKGVSLMNGTYFSLKEWNAIFYNLNPQSKETGTNVTNSEVETDYK